MLSDILRKCIRVWQFLAISLASRARYRLWKFRPAAAVQDFNAQYYLDRYPDLKNAGVDPLEHWIKHGRKEDRVGAPPKFLSFGELKNIDPKKRTVVIVSHDASRTGAPITALSILEQLRNNYNFVCLLLGPGNLTPDFARLSICTFQLQKFEPADAAYLARKFLQLHQPDVALVNSAASFAVLPVFAGASVPTITLVHEFASYLQPVSVMEDIIRWSTHLVFSAPVTLSDAVRCIPNWTPGSRAQVLPQGRRAAQIAKRDVPILQTIFRPNPDDKRRVVLGAGSVEFRKGCDLFIQCAHHMVQQKPINDLHFVWMGGGYDPKGDMDYSVYLSDQIRRSGLEEKITFIGEIASVDYAYENAAILLLTSRLDPLPNVGIEAMCLGLPIVCFELASGIADILVEDGLGNACVAPYLDSLAMADLALRILYDEPVHSNLGHRLTDLGRRRFDMTAYVSSIRNLIEAAQVDGVSEEHDILTILNRGLSETCNPPTEDQTRAVRKFVREKRSGLSPRQIDVEAFAGYHGQISPDGP